MGSTFNSAPSTYFPALYLYLINVAVEILCCTVMYFTIMTQQMSSLSIPSFQIALLMMGFKLTCVLALQAHNNSTMHSQNSAQQAVGVPAVDQPTPPCQPARPPASACLARFLHNASAEDIFKYAGTTAVFLCLSLTELAS